MTLNLIKLCVGVSEVGEIAEWCARDRRTLIHTKQTPKRADELLDGGSLYWVIKGVILVRQPIIGVATTGEGITARCQIELAREPVLTAPQPRRAFQGWRYFTAADAPPDLNAAGGEGMPTDLARQLREIGAW
ncbi:DUF1489 family protein [soil metagenome]